MPSGKFFYIKEGPFYEPAFYLYVVPQISRREGHLPVRKENLPGSAPVVPPPLCVILPQLRLQAGRLQKSTVWIRPAESPVDTRSPPPLPVYESNCEAYALA